MTDLTDDQIAALRASTKPQRGRNHRWRSLRPQQIDPSRLRLCRVCRTLKPAATFTRTTVCLCDDCHALYVREGVTVEKVIKAFDR